MADYNCRLCNHNSTVCVFCDNGSKFRKRTNADKIRSMDDAELAEFINTVANDSIDTISAYGTKTYTEIWEDKESTLKWLQSEAE